MSIRVGVNYSSLSNSDFDDVMSSLDLIQEETGAFMQWGNPTDSEVFFEYSFKNEINEECAMAMIRDLLRDYPSMVTLQAL